jgi:hypothetical protein
MSQFPGLWRQGPSTPAYNTSNQHITFWQPRRDISSRPRSVWLDDKPTGACHRCDRECLAPCWMLLLGENPCWGLAKSRFPCTACPVSLSLPVFLRKTPIMVSDQQLLANFGLTVILALGCSCSLPASRDQAQGLFGYTLCYVGGVLIGCGTWHFLSFPSCQISLLPETVTQEWRFVVTGSDPVPPGGDNLQAHVVINPSGIHHASRMCLPLLYPKSQDTFSAPSLVPPHFLHLCLPSPPWAFWDSGLPWKTCIMVPYDFLKLIPH